MRNISFALTTTQIMEGTKTVTRRLGWLHAKPGQLLRPVRKCMGLRPGEKLDVLRDPIGIVSVPLAAPPAAPQPTDMGARLPRAE